MTPMTCNACNRQFWVVVPSSPVKVLYCPYCARTDIMTDKVREPDDSRWDTLRRLAELRRFAQDPTVPESVVRDYLIEARNMYEALTAEYANLVDSLANRHEEIGELRDALAKVRQVQARELPGHEGGSQ